MPIRGLVFVIFSAVFVRFSWRCLFKPTSHGFYRFFVFELLLTLVLLNHPSWFVAPFSPLQIVSWLLLALSILFVVWGLQGLKVHGEAQQRDQFPANHAFENTTVLVEHGIYRFVRHPMYGSLFLLTWGACFKQVTAVTLGLSGVITVLLVITAKVEESENRTFFGESYHNYCRRTKMFIPFLL